MTIWPTNKGVLKTSNGVIVAEIPLIQTGRESLSGSIGNGAVASVTFNKEFEKTPIVIVFEPAYNGGNSIGVRARNVSTTGCEVFYEENEGEDGSHASSTLCWVAFHPGRYTVDGVTIEAGIHTTSTTATENSGTTVGDTVSYSSSFGATPTVLHTLNSYNNGKFSETGANSTGTSSFNLYQEIGDDNSTSTTTEDIGWVAIENVGAATIDGTAIDTTYSAGDGSNDGVDNTPQSNSYAQSFGSTPNIVSKHQTRNGSEGSWARGAGTWDSTGFNAYAEENAVNEQGHTSEDFGWFAIPDGSVIMGTA